MQYDNTNRGALWKNDNMRPDKNDPHFTGQQNITTSCPHCNQQISIDQQVSAWKPDPEKAGPRTPVLSLSMRDKINPNAQPKPEQPSQPVANPAAEIDDNLPW